MSTWGKKTIGYVLRVATNESLVGFGSVVFTGLAGRVCRARVNEITRLKLPQKSTPDSLGVYNWIISRILFGMNRRNIFGVKSIL